MEIKAKLNYLRIAPRKVRLITDLIRGMDVKGAENQLKFIPQKSAVPVLKLLNSAIANAKNNFNIEKEDLFIKTITVNEGPPFKRWRAHSRGRALPIAKRTSHISLILNIKEGAKIEKKPVEKIKSSQAEMPKSEVLSEKPKEIKEEEKSKIKDTPKRAPKKIKKQPKVKSLAKKIFRRKSF